MNKTFTTEATTIRVSKQMTEELRKLREKHNLPSMSDALALILDQKATEKVRQLREELNLDELKQMIEMEKAFTTLLWLVISLGIDEIGREKIKEDPLYQNLFKQLTNLSEKTKLEIPKEIEDRIRIVDEPKKEQRIKLTDN
ncbi:MAG: hypothetical protein GH144_01325 [Clostridia bacterium]|jgi:Arc/MetJ-type ribon-helix-helix transcriptional regulator|nr:hypothetical protein [Clostridia bacterium]